MIRTKLYIYVCSESGSATYFRRNTSTWLEERAVAVSTTRATSTFSAATSCQIKSDAVLHLPQPARLLGHVLRPSETFALRGRTYEALAVVMHQGPNLKTGHYFTATRRAGGDCWRRLLAAGRRRRGHGAPREPTLADALAEGVLRPVQSRRGSCESGLS